LRPTLKTRKPIDKLVAEDFAKFPIWEFAADEEDVAGRDETWVRPVDARSVRKGVWSLSVASEFRTASGLLVPGFVTVTTAGQIEVGGGVLLPKGHYLFIHATNKAARSALARTLGLSLKQTFPLAFTLCVPIGREKELRSGSIA
jgi:hypothetical protein